MRLFQNYHITLHGKVIINVLYTLYIQCVFHFYNKTKLLNVVDFFMRPACLHKIHHVTQRMQKVNTPDLICIQSRNFEKMVENYLLHEE